MKSHPTRCYEVLVRLQKADTLPEAFEIVMPMEACLSEDGKDVMSYDLESRKSHLFGRPTGNIMIQVQMYSELTYALIIREIPASAPEGEATVPQLTHLPQLQARHHNAVTGFVIENDINFSVWELCSLAIERLKNSFYGFGQIKNRLRQDYREIDEIYDSHFVRLEVSIMQDISQFCFNPFTYQLQFTPKALTDSFFGWKIRQVHCIWKAKNGAYTQKVIDIVPKTMTEDVSSEPFMKDILFEEYETAEHVPYHGDLIAWRKNNICYFMKPSSFHMYQSDLRALMSDGVSVILDCNPEKNISDHVREFFRLAEQKDKSFKKMN